MNDTAPTIAAMLADRGAASILETIVDLTSIYRVLEVLNDVCNAKASHLSENWQDTEAAKAWESVAKLVDKAAQKACNHDLT